MKASARSLAVAVGCLRTKTPNQNPTRLYYFFLVARRVDERDQTGRGKKKRVSFACAELIYLARDATGSISPLDSGVPVNSPAASRASENSNWNWTCGCCVRWAGILAASPWRVRGRGGGCGRRARSVDGLASRHWVRSRHGLSGGRPLAGGSSGR